MKTSVTKNEYNKSENCQPQIENPNYIENKIKINEMKQNIIREIIKVTNTDMKDRESLKNDKKVEKLKTFWSIIWSHKKPYCKKSKVDRKYKKYKNKEPQKYEDITMEEVINTLKRTYKWKLPEIDKISNFWLHYLSFTYRLMAKLI